MATTKQQLILDSVEILSSNVNIPSLGQGTNSFLVSATVAYDYIVGTQLENFIYGFGLSVFKLENPEIDENDKDSYATYSIPISTGYIICVNTQENAPNIKGLIGSAGKQGVPSLNFVKLPKNKLQVASNNDDLSLFYIDLDAAVSDMSNSFQNGVRYGIARELAFKHFQSSKLRLELGVKSRQCFSEAKKTSLQNQVKQLYRKTSREEAYRSVNTAGQIYELEGESLINAVRKGGPYGSR